jgi:hypothetical protein
LFLIPRTSIRAKQGADGMQEQGKVMFVSGHGVDVV